MRVNENFARNLRKYRTAQNLTQQALAESANLKVSLISLIETGRNGPSLCTASKLANALGVSLDALITKEKSNEGG